MNAPNLLYSRTPGGLKASRGSRVVGEIHEPISGGSRHYWFKSLVSGANGRAPTLREAKQQLEHQITVFFDSHASTARLLAESKAAAPVPRSACAGVPLVECPECNAMVGNLVRHRREMHNLAPVPRSQAAMSARVINRVPPPNCVKCPECESFVNQKNFAKHLTKVHGRANLANHTPAAARPAPAAGATCTTSAVAPSPDEFVKCPTCEAQVKARNLDKHLRIHGKAPLPSSVRKTLVSPTWKQDQGEVSCADCGLWLPSNELADHRRRSHITRVAATSSTTKPAASVAKKAAKPTSIVICVECQQRVQRHKLREHMAEHRKAQEKVSAGARTREKATRKQTLQMRDLKVFDSVAERRANRALDATRDHGHTYREWGRFGSSPSYDDYGEDSHA